MAVTTETVIAYRSSSGRRFFSKKGAIRSDIFTRLMKKYDGAQEEVDHECGKDWFSDRQMDRFRSIVSRYIRRFQRRIG
jgi:hypothetical protein